MAIAMLRMPMEFMPVDDELTVVVKNTFVDIVPQREYVGRLFSTPGRVEGNNDDTEDSSDEEDLPQPPIAAAAAASRAAAPPRSEELLHEGIAQWGWAFGQDPCPAAPALDRLSTEDLREGLGVLGAFEPALRPPEEFQALGDDVEMAAGPVIFHSPAPMGLHCAFVLPVVPMYGMMWETVDVQAEPPKYTPGAALVGHPPPAATELDSGSVEGTASEAAAAASEDSGPALVSKAPPPPRFQRTVSVASGASRLTFSVPAGKLATRDKTAVSDVFELPLGASGVGVPFRVQITAKKVHDRKYGQCFKTAKGRGKLALKCEGVPPKDAVPLTFRFFVGGGEKVQKPRGPVSHNFLHSSVAGLPVDQEEWDLRSAVDPETMTLTVCLEVVAASMG